MPANFIPTLEGYSGQGAFRFWCQHVLPLVYDDSLSYYELLNKVVDYLNNTIADVAAVENNVQALHTAYGQLENYTNEQLEGMRATISTLITFVNNYFDELDVQEEINTKLDAMASDGSLSALIEPLVAESAPNVITSWLNEHITPTSPAVDSSLSVSGAAADANVTGEMLKNYNNFPLIPLKGSDRELETYSYSWTGYKCTVHVDANITQSFDNLIESPSALVSPLAAGKRYYLYINNTTERIGVRIYFYVDDISTYKDFTSSSYFVIPENCTGIIIRLQTNRSTTSIDGTITTALFEYAINQNLYRLTQDVDAVPLIPFKGESTSVFNWYGYKCNVRLAAGASAVSQNIISTPNALPYPLEAGKQYYLYIKSSGYVGVRIYYYLNDDTSFNLTYYSSGVFIIPETCIGVVIRLITFPSDGEINSNIISGIYDADYAPPSEIHEMGVGAKTLPLVAFKGVNSDGFSWDGYKCNVTVAEGAGLSFNNVVASDKILPYPFEKGKTYWLDVSDTDGTVGIRMYMFFDNGTNSYGDYTSSRYITVPNNTVGIIVRVQVLDTTTEVNTTISAAVYTTKPATTITLDNEAILKDYNSLPILPFKGTNIGSYNWNNCRCHVVREGAGTMSFNNVVTSVNELPYPFVAGGKYTMYVNSTDSRLSITVFYYHDGETSSNDYEKFYKTGVITIPDDCTGIIIRVQIDATSESVDGYITAGIFNEEYITADEEKLGTILVECNSILLGSVWTVQYNSSSNLWTPRLEHYPSKWGNAPYSVVANKLGIAEENMNDGGADEPFHSSTGLAYVPNAPSTGEPESVGSFLNIIRGDDVTLDGTTYHLTPVDLTKYDYILTHLWTGDMGGGTTEHPINGMGSLSSTADDGSLVGALLGLLNYINATNPACRLILVGVPPVSVTEALSGNNVFTGTYSNGHTLTELDTLMHQLAEIHHFVYIDWQNMNLSYHYQDYTGGVITADMIAEHNTGQGIGTKLNNVHANNEVTYRRMGQYLAEHI